MPAPDQPSYRLTVAKSAARALGEKLPEQVATAVFHFITGDLLINPRRVGKPLGGELTGLHAARRGAYRVLYSIDDEARAVTVLDVDHRRDV